MTVLMVAGCTTVPAEVRVATSETCVASVYWEGFGRPLADGHRHTPHEIIAAHRTLPLGSRVLVKTQDGTRSLIVTIADRGPFVRGRCIDLSLGAAKTLGVDGITPVTLQPINWSPLRKAEAMPIIDEFLESLDAVAAKYQVIRDTHKQSRDERVTRHATEVADSQSRLTAAADALTAAQTAHNETLARHAEDVRLETEAIAAADARFRSFQERVAALPPIAAEG